MARAVRFWIQTGEVPDPVRRNGSCLNSLKSKPRSGRSSPSRWAWRKSEITRETSFVNDLNADSLDTVELVMEFEEEFELSIPDEEAEKIQTVGQAIDYIKAHLDSAQ